MTHIKINNASIIFTIYNSKTRLVRNELLKFVGAKVTSIDNNVYINALNDITLTINENERVALIGHNGAGKSTLLKLMTGLYEPQKGSIEIKGKVSSLTSLTMGIDPDSTGVENIIMRLISLGLTLKEAKAKSKDIIDFSELQEFINLPVRTYSTGMYLRLAYSIATSIVPDILIMDEMIGAGDSTFIHKTKKRNAELLEKTKIIVISSHDLNLVKELCNRAIWLKQGNIYMDGEVNDVLKEYHKENNL